MSGVVPEEDKKPNQTQIKLKIKRQDGHEMFFRIKRGTLLQNLMNAYCDRQSVGLKEPVFLFYGRRIRGKQTPDELKMEDGDEIDVMEHQIGGGGRSGEILAEKTA